MLRRHSKTRLENTYANYNLHLTSLRKLQFCSWVIIESAGNSKRQYNIETIDILLWQPKRKKARWGPNWMFLWGYTHLKQLIFRFHTELPLLYVNWSYCNRTNTKFLGTANALSYSTTCNFQRVSSFPRFFNQKRFYKTMINQELEILGEFGNYVMYFSAPG